MLALRALETPSSSGEAHALSARTRTRQRLASRLQMPGAPLEDVCVRREGPYCVERSLDRFFDGLRALPAHRKKPAVVDAQSTSAAALAVVDTQSTTAPSAPPARHVRVAAIGNSLIASDHITDIVRERLVERFGDGGRGFVLADRMAPYGRRTRAAARSQGLVPYHIALAEPGQHPYGIAGVLHVASAPASSRFVTDGAERVRLFWWDHADAPPLTISVDGKAMRTLVPEGYARARIDAETLPPGAKRIDVTTAKGAVLYGASLERATPGVILDTLGVPASDAGLFLTINDEVARDQLRALDPSLLLFVLGGNEIKRLAWGRKTLEETEGEMRALFARLHDDAPEASCLVIGPLENVAGNDAEDPFALRRQTLVINDAYRRASLAHGCAYFDTFAAMGGRGALERLQRVELLHDDLVHPRGPALDAIGELVVSALLASYDASRSRADDAEAQWAAVVQGIEARPLPAFTADKPAVEVFVGPTVVETRGFAEALGKALGVPIGRHALPVRPIGIVIELVNARPFADPTPDAARATETVDSSAREILRVVDGASGTVLARAPLAAVMAAYAELPDAEADRERARLRVLVDTARVLIAAVMAAKEPPPTGSPTTAGHVVERSRPLVLAGDAP